MATNICRYATGRFGVVMVVGALHSGHGAAGVSLDDRLTAAGCRTLSFMTPASVAWAQRATDGSEGAVQRAAVGTERAWADHVVTEGAQVVERVRTVTGQ